MRNSEVIKHTKYNNNIEYESDNAIIDIFDQLLVFDGHKVNYVLDGIKPIFPGSEFAQTLGYVNPNKAIRDHVKNYDIVTFSEIKHLFKVIPPNAQPHTLYITEAGLYSLLFSSKLPKAEKFTKWVTQKVLPTIRESGEFKIEQKYRSDLKDLNNRIYSQSTQLDKRGEKIHILKTKVDHQMRRIEKLSKENEILRENQKKSKYDEGGGVYVVQPADSNPNLHRIGKTDRMINRMGVYNTATPNKFKLKYFLNVSDPVSVELSIRSLLQKYRYAYRKDYFECSLETIIDMFNRASKWIDYNMCKDDVNCKECTLDINQPEHTCSSNTRKEKVKHKKHNEAIVDEDPSKYATYEDIFGPELVDESIYGSDIHNKQYGGKHNNINHPSSFDNTINKHLCLYEKTSHVKYMPLSLLRCDNYKY